MQSSGLLGYAIAAAICAALAVIIGFMVYAMPGDAGGSLDFMYWLGRPIRYGALYWAFLGALAGVGLRYLRTR